jgi:hypothetical protein
VCKKRAMEPAYRDISDDADIMRLLTTHNLLETGDCPENPAYRLIRHFWPAALTRQVFPASLVFQKFVPAAFT